ncbi:hypothetical protein [Microvirga massiliensis]|uniref:hypothetical protein n=1 Tax=Microvirga massiliensis TaxID=1033741 RepID=UPI00062BA66B|nr:hypothetical protein [Microvirga massiliensis]
MLENEVPSRHAFSRILHDLGRRFPYSGACGRKAVRAASTLITLVSRSFRSAAKIEPGSTDRLGFKPMGEDLSLCIRFPIDRLRSRIAQASFAIGSLTLPLNVDCFFTAGKKICLHLPCNIFVAWEDQVAPRRPLGLPDP